ncbi:hypothetical protein ACJX0J_042403, partial [Zea mays]
ACKGLELAVDEVFPRVEHRECMRHLAADFGKLFKGKIYNDNMWPASLTYSLKKHNYHLSQLHAANPKVKDWFEKSHSKLWMRSKFNEVCKVDYVNNNLAESFNAKKLLTKTRGLKMTMIKCAPFEAEVTAYDRENKQWRYPVNLEKRTCSCRQWDITGLPCIHALFFITSLCGPAAEIDQYVDAYYSVAKFNATYADNVPCIESQHQWDIVNPGFVLHALVQSRAPGRPRKTRIRSSAEGSGLGPRRRKSFGEDQQWGDANEEVAQAEPSDAIVTRGNSTPSIQNEVAQAEPSDAIVT